MDNQMTINGHTALISFEAETSMYRGEFVGLNGGADFYADSVEGLQEAGEASLNAFLAVCWEQGIKPLPPITASLLGCLPANEVDDYRAYLESKYQ